MSDELFLDTPVSAAEPKSNDLSKQIIQAMKREPGDEVRCVHIDGDKYRCNWWAPENRIGYDNPAMKGAQIGTTFRIRKSSFMRVTRSNGELKIIELPA